MFLIEDMESNEIALTTDQIEKLKIMERLMHNYSKVVEDSLMFTGNSSQTGQP
ncbi:hypothetical protein [Sutcliffiella deserti]|uniref:hypothetical protein n=1 Tax=Sutcliffiella deserti TaxID=2875501 RepID=UPI001CBC0887|nr:hypothetical protein [Sutcliffiella deserti]